MIVRVPDQPRKPQSSQRLRQKAACASEPCSSSIQENGHGARWVRLRRSRWLSEHLRGLSVLFHEQKDRLSGEGAVSGQGDLHASEEGPAIVDLDPIAGCSAEVAGAWNTPGR